MKRVLFLVCVASSGVRTVEFLKRLLGDARTRPGATSTSTEQISKSSILPQKSLFLTKRISPVESSTFLAGVAGSIGSVGGSRIRQAL